MITVVWVKKIMGEGGEGELSDINSLSLSLSLSLTHIDCPCYYAQTYVHTYVHRIF